MPNHTEILNAKPIAIDAIVGEAKALFEQDYRLVTYSVVDLGDGNVDIIYHFDKDLEFVHYRLTTPKDQPIPSLTPVYFAALLIENEARDQFGLTFDGLVLDFNRTLYLDDEITGSMSAPFCKISTIQKKA
ncbi:MULTISPECIES: NADH-quinone oxidoreductase subunit C [Desulfovibrionaceae]|jgi:ech hydrogenase subunit D|uniref:Ech hydrogenase, subunit EchD, putative n=2 Tax=Nitratidesulfovibrio vulgaris TaxID=881 RepID=Q72EY7_NITV2|nr:MULTISPECIES: NADH-quinone oxidoreductase subunit C [Desulfovibrionaceae]GEB80034.1 ech hydrogenase subunit EchD [Desulfovibrio desulfuricans]AAS94914.1 Ech hydrogenase, subunit EchD, putative [Nitratidesulfovibrio vulgaris str. Hildenborough]ABM29520.1 ech hydrogenase subunit D [Nitratidesulfovibrio vulgaris DP4]ADP85565.1 NADH dehydrogenase (ubiquinone) 30 kDa subunit [Nitratidesulfovibrio vulgaris RCH1]WCB47139.1 NADH-quinone oxidoreductase subunit C [Nitratidesulfovibrio vulgaris]